MMKSQVDALLHVTGALLKDCALAYPALKDSLSKDFERLRLYCQSRGRGLFTLDLPHLDSLLLKGLEDGFLILEGPLTTAVSKRIRVPRLYGGLWLNIFDKDASLKHEVDVNSLAFLRALLGLGKKLEVECSYDRKQTVVRAYHDIESRLRKPTLRWELDDLGLRVAGTNRDSSLGDSGNVYCSQQEDLFGETSGNASCTDRGDDHVYPFPLSGGNIDEDSTSKARSSDWKSSTAVHLVQAVDRFNEIDFGLFHKERNRIDLIEDQSILNNVQRVADIIIGSFDIYDPLLYSEELEVDKGAIGFRHGPGAVAERLKNWEKSQFPNWPLKLQGTFPFESCGKTAGDERVRPHNHEVPSRLIMVPKTSKGPRLIAAEPTSHQWCQQLTWQFLEMQCRKLFRGYFIDFRDQTKSGDMVLKASLNRDLATVDLSDASDRLTCWTVERIFRSNPSILTALHAARTRYLRDEISEGGSFLSLRKFASQGTATTFPVMSLVMLCIALGCCLEGRITLRKIWKLRDQVRVFGDDIIIPTHGYVRLVRCMDLLELKVNSAKSYTKGFFRESCGVDGYKGYDVTPVRPKYIIGDSPASCQAVVDTSNNLYLKGYWNAANACIALLPPHLQCGIRVVGVHDVGFRGLTSYSGGYEQHLTQRWNSRLHRYEVRTWTILDHAKKRPRDGYPALLDFFTSKHSYEQARTVSEFTGTRKTRIGLLWEPSNSHAHVAYGDEEPWSLDRSSRSNRVFDSKDWILRR
nr:MAG: hypothetical protein 3 [Leviviridae sp.]